MPDRATLPVDGNRSHVPLVPAVRALAVTQDDTISSATDLALEAGTSFIEVSALYGGVYMRYAATASAANSDEYIQAGATRHYYIPTGITTVSFIQDQAGAAIRVIQK